MKLGNDLHNGNGVHSLRFLVVLIGLVSVLGCSLVMDDQAGVTSTGNAGEVSGVVRKPNVALTKLLATTSSFAMVHIQSLSNAWSDSTPTDALGAFHFAKVPAGRYSLLATLQGDTAQLELIEVKAGAKVRVQLLLGGISTELSPEEYPQGRISNVPSADSIEVFLQYNLLQASEVSVRRDSIGTCGVVNGQAEGLWKYSISGPVLELQTSSLGCPALTFFSAKPDVFADNRWFLNGNLRAWRDSVSIACQDALPLVPEVWQSGMETVVLDVQATNSIRVVLLSDDWCLVRDAQLPPLLASLTEDSLIGCHGNAIDIGFFPPRATILREQNGTTCTDVLQNLRTSFTCLSDPWPALCNDIETSAWLY